MSDRDKSKEAADTMDWSCFDNEPIDQTCFCKCGAQYRTHAKLNMDLRRSVPKDSCPGCGRYDKIWKTSSDPEIWIL